MKMFATLYKEDSKGKLRVWNITANSPSVGVYTVEHGAEYGKMQSTVVSVERKNVGKANETSLEEQAELEAQSKWNKQVDKGYRPNTTTGTGLAATLKSAKQYLPMLAKSFKDHAKKIRFPCFYQPKLDGIRCISYLDEDSGEVVMLSRKGKPFKMLPHLLAPIRDVLTANPDLILDGELYSHSIDFQKITSIVRQSKTEDEDADKIEYHIYDCFKDGVSTSFPFANRALHLAGVLGAVKKPLVLVETHVIRDPNEISTKMNEYTSLGYEGIMLRNADGLYEQDRRSENLQKVKNFMDEEFEIVGGKEGKGKFEGMCIFTLITKDKKEFDAMPMGTEELRREYWKKLPKLVGKMMTVRYFELSNDGIPRFPIGVEIRDYE